MRADCRAVGRGEGSGGTLATIAIAANDSVRPKRPIVGNAGSDVSRGKGRDRGKGRGSEKGKGRGRRKGRGRD